MDLDQIRGGPDVISTLVHASSANGRPYINRHNLSALGAQERMHPVTLRAVTTRTSDSRKDEFAEIFKAGYFHINDEHHLLVMYDWNISRTIMADVLAPILFDIFDYAQGDILMTALVEIVSTTERITRTSRALKWVQRLIAGDDPMSAVSRNQISLHVSLLSRKDRGEEAEWKLRTATNTVGDFHVSPQGQIAVISDQCAFQVEPKTLIRAIKGSGWMDEDFRAARGGGILVGPKAVLSRYTPHRFPFNIPVYDDGALKVYDPKSGRLLLTQQSDRFIMTSADGSGSLFAVERTDTGRRRVTSRRTDHGQTTALITPH